MFRPFYKNKKIILKKSQEIFSNSSLLIPKIGIELEFFLLKKNFQAVENQVFLADFIFLLKTELTKKFSLIFEVEKERGISQIEIKTIFTSDLSKLGDELEEAKNFVRNFAEEKNLIASFAAQPFFDDCGNALQFNISLHDQNDKNIFETDENFLNEIARILLQATNYMMIFLAPKAEDYLRFSFDLNRNLFKQGKFPAPVNLSFGADNRSCAIRVPSIKNSTDKNYGKRIEYRVAAADADFFLVAAAILSALIFKIGNKDKAVKPCTKQLFGNAFDDQYQLENFCKNLQEAEENFISEGNFIRKNLEKLIS